MIDASPRKFLPTTPTCAAAHTLHMHLGAPVKQVNQQSNEDDLTRLRAQLGAMTYELAWSKGAKLTTEQAIALALS